MSLTDTECKNTKPTAKIQKKFDGGGLYLQINPTGSKLWKMKYRVAGKEKTLSLGIYPTVTLAEAREAREKARKLHSGGQDPSLVKQEQKRAAVASAAETFKKLGYEWHEKHKGEWTENHADTIMRRLERDIFPQIGHLPVKDIATPRILTVIEKIEKRGTHDTARRCLQYCRSIFTYAQMKGHIGINPAEVKAKHFLASRKGGHHASMTSKQLPEFLNKLYRNEARLFLQTQLAMEFMMLTFVRTKELRHARWEDIDFNKNQWRVPAEFMKMDEEHIVPLSRQALAILEKLQSLNGHRKWVFPGQRDPLQPMSDGAILMALDRMGYRGIHTGHGFRALAMTILMEELDYRHEVPDLQLAHSKGDAIRRAYDKTKFLSERVRMMQDWADYLDGLTKNSNVILGKFSIAQ